MNKITMTALTALTVLFGASFAASASDDGRYERNDRRINTSESSEYCRDGNKRCEYDRRRDSSHESRESRKGDDDNSRQRNDRRHHDDN